MSDRERVLFICEHNSARSQMAEAWLEFLCGDRFEGESAGLEKGVIHPLTVRVMDEVGIDVSGKTTDDVFELVKEGRIYSYAVTVCDQAAAERCPVFVGVTKRLHWSFPNPAVVEGSEEEKLAAFREARDSIRAAVQAFCRKTAS